MSKLKKVFSLVLVLVLILSNTAFAKSIIEVMKENKVEISTEEVEIIALSLSEQKIGRFIIKAEDIGKVKIFNEVPVKNVKLVKEKVEGKLIERLYVQINSDDKEILDKVAKFIEDYNKAIKNKEYVDNFIENEDDSKVIKVEEKDNTQKENSDKKQEEENKETAKSDLLDKIGDFKLDKDIVNNIKDIFKKDIEEQERAKELLKKIENFKLDENVTKEIAKLYKEYLERIKETELLDKIADFKLDKDIVNDIKDIFKKDIEDKNKEKEEANILDKIADFKLNKEVTEYIKDLLNKDNNKEEEKDILDKIGDFKLDPDVTKHIKDLFTDYLNEKAETDLLDKIGGYKLDKDVVNDIKNIFAGDIKERKEAEELIKKIEEFKLNEDVVKEIADLYKEFLERVKETELLEKAADYKLDKDVVNDIKDIFKEAMEDEETKKKLLEAADYKLDKDVVNDIKDMFINDFGKDKEDNKELSRVEGFNSGKTIDEETFRQEFLKLINEERAKLNRAPLEYNEALKEGTDLRSSEMAEFGYLRSGENLDQKHTRPDGKSTFRTAFNYLENYELLKGGNLGENILLQGFASREYNKDAKYYDENLDVDCTVEEYLTNPVLLAKSLFEQWKHSQGHYDNMMSEDYKSFWISAKLGDGYKEKDGTKDMDYTVLIGTTVFDVYDKSEYPKFFGKESEENKDGENLVKPAEKVEESKEDAATEEKTEEVKEDNKAEEIKEIKEIEKPSEENNIQEAA